jgi:integrase
MESMMSGLFERGRLDILRGIQDGTYSPLQVWDAYRSNELERLPTAATLAPLKESMEKWIAKKECSEAHRRSLQQSTRHLIGKTGSSTVGDLPSLLTTLRERMRGVHARSFNLARAAAQAFIKSTLKRSHPIYSAITDIEPLPVTAQRRKHPLTPADLSLFTATIGFHNRNAAWAMALTGMGPTEYFSGRWENQGDRVHIDGTKRAGRVRDVPLIDPIARPQVSYVAFRKALAGVTGKSVTPYDLRRSFANWMEAAGIPRTRRKAYMGHGAKDITDLYERHEVEAYLAGDAKLLAQYIYGATEIPRVKLVGKA